MENSPFHAFFYIEFIDVFKFVFIEYDQQIEPDLRLS